MIKGKLKKYKTQIITGLLIFFVVLMLILFTYTMIDFYNDYKCSTTTDIRWFLDNNCMRYYD